MRTTLRQLLTRQGFDWEQGIIVVPAGEDSANVVLPMDSPVLEREFNLILENDKSATPMFTAEDPTAMYFLCHVPQEKFSRFQKVETTEIEGVQIGSVKGYPYGPKNHGIQVTFNKPVEIFVTKAHHSPAFAGCPEIHHYCMGEDRKEVMDIFMMRLLVGYMNCYRNPDRVKEGYVKILQRLFDELEPKEQVLPPLEKDN